MQMQLTTWQLILVLLYTTYAVVGGFQGFRETVTKKNAYGLTPQYYPLGSFVWADILVFGPFWSLVSIVSLIRQDWLLFLLIISLFWLVRSVGETIYWFNQQFSSIDRNPIKNLPGIQYIHSDAIWFVYQIVAQCITVISVVTTLYLAHAWLQTL